MVSAETQRCRSRSPGSPVASNERSYGGKTNAGKTTRSGLAASVMSVVVHAGRLRYEMVRRGWSASDLARESRLSPATISVALAGRPIAAKSLDLIASAFTRVPARKAIDGLIMGDLHGIG